ncbi:MAG: PDZ domain-containing protein, partial [Acetobacteraceae bacterium]
ATLGYPPGAESASAQNHTAARPREGAHLGVRLQALTPQDREHYQIPATVKGALIVGVVPGGPAYNSGGIVPGLVITGVNRVPTPDPAAVTQELQKLPPDETILLRVYQGGPQPGGIFVLVHPEPSDSGSGGGQH